MAATMPRAPAPAILPYLLLASALVVAACGLVYELAAGALASYLIGDTLTQFSSVIGAYLFSMGLGAFLARWIRTELVESFIRVEILVGLVGGYSSIVLFAAFAMGAHFAVLLYALVLLLGVLVGLEIPLLMRILRDRLDFSELVSQVLSFDYFGALLGSLAFPLFFVPRLGIVRTSLVFGLINIGVAGLCIYAFRNGIRVRALTAGWAAATLVLCVGMHEANGWLGRAEAHMYPNPVILSKQTPYQRITLTHGQDDTRLYLNHHLQFSSRDEYRYHEALVHPALASLRSPRTALVLGGGDGLAARELLRYGSLENIVLVDIDAEVTQLFRTEPRLARLNASALANPRLEIVNQDAWRWLDASPARFDAIVVDLPDPSNFALGKLYSTTFYRLLRQHLNDEGVIALQATSPLFARKAFWCIVQTLNRAGLETRPYHALVPTFGEWGFVIATKSAYRIPSTLPQGMRFLSKEQLSTMFVFSPDMAQVPVEENRLDNQILVQYYEQGWRHSVSRE